MSRSSVMAPGAAAIGPYSHGVFTCNSFDGLLFLSGQTAIDPVTGKLVDGTIGALKHHSALGTLVPFSMPPVFHLATS